MADAALTPATDLEWRYVADTVMGGVSEGRAQRLDGAIQLTGRVSTANNGGFIQARTEVRGLVGTALTLRVRGNGERYFIHLRTRATMLPWQYYQAPFETSTNWEDIELPFQAFRRSGRMLPAKVAPESVRSVGLVAYGRDHIADVELAALGPI